MNRLLARSALALLALTACGDVEAPPSVPPPPVEIEVVTLEARPPVVWVTAPVQATRRATLRTEATGRVIEAPYQRGAFVEEGAVILRVAVPRSESAVSEARAGLEQVRIGLRQAVRAREDAEALARDNAITASALDAARDREAGLRAQLAGGEARALGARLGVEEAELRAPFSGVLASYTVNVGEAVRPGLDVAVLVDPSGLEAELLLDPAEAQRTEVGSTVSITTRTHPDEIFQGRITLVSEVLDPRTRRLPVRVAVEDPAHRLQPGAFAQFAVPVGPPRDVAQLPERAVVERFGHREIFVVGEGDVASAREVTIGALRAGQIEIVDGVEAGERVIVRGSERVVDGQVVHVVVDETP